MLHIYVVSLKNMYQNSHVEQRPAARAWDARAERRDELAPEVGREAAVDAEGVVVLKGDLRNPRDAAQLQDASKPCRRLLGVQP